MGPAGIHIKIRWKLLYGRAGIKLTVNLILHCLVGQVHHGSLALLHVQVVSGPAPRGFVITICRRVRNSVRWPGAGKCARNPYLFIFLNTFKYVSLMRQKLVELSIPHLLGLLSLAVAKQVLPRHVRLARVTLQLHPWVSLRRGRS